MGLNMDPETERMAAEVAAHRALRLREFLEREIWPDVPPDVRGRALTRADEHDLLGYSDWGV